MSIQSAPPDFTEALYSLRKCDFGQHVKASEIVAPSEIAPFTAAIRLDCEPVRSAEASGGSGRLVILHDPAGQPGWEGTFRLVAMVHAHVNPELTREDLIEQVAWSWLHDCLIASGAGYCNAAGSVTRVVSSGFGGLKMRSQSAQMEIRASWTPNTTDLSPHGSGLANCLAMMSGHPIDLGAGVIPAAKGSIQLV